jgi:hypothetical protein
MPPPNRSLVPDTSSSSGRDSSPSSPSESSSPATGREAETALLSRHVLPSDLDAAIRHLDDEELDKLVLAALGERSRRKKLSVPEESQPKRRAEAVALPQGKLNAVRAAFKAGVTPARIAREFGISQSDVQRALASDQSPNAKPRICHPIHSGHNLLMAKWLAATQLKMATPLNRAPSPMRVSHFLVSLSIFKLQ